MKKVDIGLLVGVAVLGMVGVMVWAVYGSASQSGKYVTFKTAEQTGETYHISGKWDKNKPYKYDPSRDCFSFYLADSTKDTRLVKYYEPMPPNFLEAEKVMIEGQFEGDAFVADKIFMKCPSKYNDTKITSGNAGEALREENYAK